MHYEFLLLSVHEGKNTTLHTTLPCESYITEEEIKHDNNNKTANIFTNIPKHIMQAVVQSVLTKNKNTRKILFILFQFFFDC